MNKFKLMILTFLIAQTATLNIGYAKTFTSQFSEFELPTGWECILEGSEYVCQSDDKERKKEAIIILAAKYRGEQDSLDQYQAYLKQPKSFTLPGGRTQISEAKSVTLKTINGQRWVDALHLASEVPGFYTRYLASVKDNLGIAVTFSVGKDHYDAYQDMFEKVIATLKVFDQKSTATGQWKAKTAETELLNGAAVVDDTGTRADITTQKAKSSGSDSETTDSILMIAGICAVAFIIFKMKNKNKKK